MCEKTRILNECESKYFRLSREIEAAKSGSDWDKTQKLVDERFKSMNDCMKKLVFVDEKFISTLTKNKE